MTDLTLAEIEAMSPDEIDGARRAGRLDGLLGRVDQLTRTDVSKMSAAEVLQAQKRGALDSLLGRKQQPAPAAATLVAEDAAADRGSADQGARSGGQDGAQLSREHIQTMTSTQIAEATRKGRLNDLLGRQ